MISVLTPTIRPEGLELVRKALKRQSFKDFEWLIGSGFQPSVLDNPPCPTRWVKDDFQGGVWTLNRCYNALIEASSGELIVSWQDFTFAKPDALEKFWTNYEQDKQDIQSGVGNKYESDDWLVCNWKDPRMRADQGTYYPCFFNDIEFNFCAIPKKALEAVGGFDEEMDFLGFGMDGFGVLDRLNLVGGWDFRLDQSNESFSLGHGRPKGWEEKNLMYGKYQEHRKAYIANPTLSYL